MAKTNNLIPTPTISKVDIPFDVLAQHVRSRFEEMRQTGRLFTSSITGDILWGLYLNSFAPGDDPVFRDPKSSVNNCNNDKNFIRRYGNVVALDDNNNIMTMFDVDVTGSTYHNSMRNMSKALQDAPISSVFYTTYDELVSLPYEKNTKKQESFQLGHQLTHKKYTPEEVAKFDVVNSTDVYTFHHFWVSLPKEYVLFTDKSIESIYADKNTTHTLFLKGLSIPLETLEVIRDLMVQGSMLRADLYQTKVEEFIQIKRVYEARNNNKTNWTWKRFQDVPFARFANELIGTTCIELAEGKDINEVCKAFNKRVDPANYMRASAAITQRQIDAAAKRIDELGYTESFDRRFATLDDIYINEILHCNMEGTPAKGGLFAKVKPTAGAGLSRHKRAEFDQVEEVSIETFMKDILPNSKGLSVLLESKFTNNLVTLTTSNNPNCKPLMKWSNPFSWTYNGNLAGRSSLTEKVSERGGRVDGAFRFSHSWNELEPNQSLMDLHVFLPTNEKRAVNTHNDTYGNNKERVGWNARSHLNTMGRQDVDYTHQAPEGFVPVENITFPDFDKLPDGEYKCMIHNWHFRNSGGRGKAEVAFNGELYQYIYPATTNKEWVPIATVTLKNGEWSIKHHLDLCGSTSANLWGLDSDQFHKVDLMCLSPNYWGDNAVGNKHYFFFLDKCYADSPMRSFHIENLNGELLQDRKVLEVLGMKDKLEPTTKQLAGVGFTNDSKESLIVKVEGSFKRTVKIKF